MSFADAPLTRPSAPHGTPAGDAPSGVVSTVRAMQIGQYVIAVVLTVIGAVRAIADGTPIATAVVAGLAMLAWHAAGAILPRRARSELLVTLWLLGFGVVWIAAVAVSPEFVWLAFVLWLLAGHLLPVRWGLLFSAVVLAVVIVAPILHHGTTSYANIFGPLVGGVFAYGISRGYLQLLRDASERERMVTSLTRAQHEMAELQDELALAQRHSGAIEERTRISRDIHDTVAQGLSSIRLLAHAGRGRTADQEAERTFAQLEALAGENLVDVRRIIAALAPAQLENDALAAALQRMLDRASGDTDIYTELRVDETMPQLPTAVEVALLRTAQSALGNVRLHSGAKRVVVSLMNDGGESGGVRLDMRDDGVGFDVSAFEAAETDSAEGSGSASYGLRFMRARLRDLGGGLDIESSPGEGTAISVYLPIRAVIPNQVHTRTTGDHSTEETA